MHLDIMKTALHLSILIKSCKFIICYSDSHLHRRTMKDVHFRQMRLPSLKQAPTPTSPVALRTNQPTAPAILLLLWLSSGVWRRRAWQASKEEMRAASLYLSFRVERGRGRVSVGDIPISKAGCASWRQIRACAHVLVSKSAYSGPPTVYLGSTQELSFILATVLAE